jgi:hypothetical protein
MHHASTWAAEPTSGAEHRFCPNCRLQDRVRFSPPAKRACSGARRYYVAAYGNIGFPLIFSYKA